MKVMDLKEVFCKKYILTYFISVIVLSIILSIVLIYHYTMGFDFTQEFYPALNGSYLMDLREIIIGSCKMGMKIVCSVVSPTYWIIILLIKQKE